MAGVLLTLLVFAGVIVAATLISEKWNNDVAELFLMGFIIIYTLSVL